MKRFIILSILLFLFTSIVSIAQNFTANIEETGSYYRLTFSVSSNDVSDFTPPSLAAFEVLSGPSTSTFSSYQMINGHTKHSETTSYTYILSAKKEGNIIIGSATIKANGRTLRSKPISLHAQVKTSTANSQSKNRHESDIEGENLQQAGSAVTNRDLFIDVTPSRTRVCEQEAVLLTYRIHSRIGVGLANTQLTTKPDFKGLISQEIPLPGNQIQTTLEHRNGTTYRQGVILQYVIFPQQSGRIEIPSITFDCTVVQQDNSMDLAEAFFNGGGSIGVQVRRTVPITYIQVDALPKPKPANFSGAVGKFSIKGEILNPEIKTNDVATYRITLNGLGNLKLITQPKVSFPTDFDTYDAKTNDNTRITANGLSGQLTFDYTFVPRNIGKYTIPQVDFVYYDSESKEYKTISTKSIAIDVKKGEQSNADVDRQLALLKSDIHDIHTTTQLNKRLFSLDWGSLSYWILLTILFILFLSLIFIGSRYVRSQSDITKRLRSNASKQVAKRLQEAEKLLNQPNTSAFYAAVSKAMCGYLSDYYGLAHSEINRENIEKRLQKSGVTQENINSFLQVFDTCQYAQYAQISNDNRKEVLQQALNAIEKIKS